MNAPFRTTVRVKGSRSRADVTANPWVVNVKSPFEGASTKARVVQWQPTAQGPNSLTSGSLGMLVRRSRERRRNDGTADLIIDRIVTNAVGAGIKPMFRTSNQTFNEQMAELFYDWTEEACADGDSDYYGQQYLAASESFEAGEVFGRLRYRRPGDMQTVPMQIQVLEQEFCPLEQNSVFDDSGARTIQGIEFSPIGKRTAYYFHKTHPGDQYTLRTTNREPAGLSRVLAEEVMHLRYIKRSGQVRGIPWLTTCLILLESIDKYNDAQVQRQVAASMFAGFVETDPTIAAQFFAGQLDDEGPDLYADLAPVTPSSMQILTPGQKVSWSSPPGVGTDYAAFMREQMHRLAASGKVLYEQATGDYSGVNDRTWRAAMLDFRRHIRAIQWHMMIFRWCQPVINAWVDVGILSGNIVLPPGVTARQLKRVEHVCDRWDYINPVQDVAAEVAEMNAGLASRSQKVSARGDDIQRLDKEIASDHAREDDLGLVFSGTLPPAPAPPDPADMSPPDPPVPPPQ